MGEVFADITLKNADDVGNARSGYIKAEDVREVTVTSVVDTGAHNLYITEDVFKSLGLRIEEHRNATVANGMTVPCWITSPVRIQWEDRYTVVHASVLPGANEILMGVIPLEDMDLTIDPKNFKLRGAHGDKPIFRV